MKIFLAASFTDRLNAANGIFDAEYRRWLEQIMHLFETSGHSVLSAHVRENWGERLDSPAVALHLDLKWIDESDLLVAHLGTPPSPGVQLEIGYCIAKKKPMMLLIKNNFPIPYLTDGIPSVSKCIVIRYKENFDLMAQIKSIVGQLHISLHGYDD